MRKRFLWQIIFSLCLLGTLGHSPTMAQTPFLVTPYLQLGNNPKPSTPESLALLWQTLPSDANWSVQVRRKGEKNWRNTPQPQFRKVVIPGDKPYTIYEATLNNLVPGARFEYQVQRNGQVVFTSQGAARKRTDSHYRFVVFGDCGTGSTAQKEIAYQTWQLKPDFIFLTGDLVYDKGRQSEYRQNFFPIYNEPASNSSNNKAKLGAPLLSTTLTLAAPGNHDILYQNLGQYPDGLAYFLNWSLPLNGPLKKADTKNIPQIKASETIQKAFQSASKERYPVMANYSFEYGNSHWTILDSNPYVNWSSPELRAWLEADLKAAQHKTWLFVAFHHPPFHSSKIHASEKWMRSLTPIFEKYEVDIVWSGHVHNYQRSFPMILNGSNAGIHKSFSGATAEKPVGVIYIVSGAGGAGVYNPELATTPKLWQPFTAKYLGTHSLTDVQVRWDELIIRQISTTGHVLDKIIIKKWEGC